MAKIVAENAGVNDIRQQLRKKHAPEQTHVRQQDLPAGAVGREKSAAVLALLRRDWRVCLRMQMPNFRRKRTRLLRPKLRVNITMTARMMSDDQIRACWRMRSTKHGSAAAMPTYQMTMRTKLVSHN